MQRPPQGKGLDGMENVQKMSGRESGRGKAGR